ncbi:MAG: CPBP family intramembrane metalloprotease [Flaviflexus sp.]|nr:CPBP family intramembrane metalloprotease [Flaviflexus sp.]
MSGHSTSRGTTLLTAAGLAFGGIILLRIIGGLLRVEPQPGPRTLLAQVIAIGAIVVVLAVLRLARHLTPGGSWAWGRGWPFLACGAIILILGQLAEVKGSPSLPLVAAFVVHCLLTGIFEEFLCRAGVQNICRRSFSPLAGVLISSALFGVIHFANLTEQGPIETTTQVLYAFCLGTFLGYLYELTRNIYFVALLHAGFNMLGSYSSLGLEKSGQDIPLGAAAIQILIIAPLLILAITRLRKLTRDGALPDRRPAEGQPLGA